MISRKLVCLAMVLVCPAAFAAVKSEVVEYKDGGTTCKGFVAYDDAVKGKRPAVILVHEWWGQGPNVRKNAERLAEMGYVGFALDMYGDRLYTDDVKEAGKNAGLYKGDPAKAKARFDAALETVKRRAEVDSTKIAAIGYCFGGTMVLDRARQGEDLKGVVSFHGGLATVVPNDKATPKARILVCHGADDPFVKAEEVKAFEKEMGERKADLTFISFPGAVHSFTNPDADRHHLDGAKYNAEADAKSWGQMKIFLAECFK